MNVNVFRTFGHTVFKDKSLEELAEIWKHNKDFEDSQMSFLDEQDNTPCMCAF